MLQRSNKSLNRGNTKNFLSEKCASCKAYFYNCLAGLIVRAFKPYLIGMGPVSNLADIN